MSIGITTFLSLFISFFAAIDGDCDCVDGSRLGSSYITSLSEVRVIEHLMDLSDKMRVIEKAKMMRFDNTR